MRFGLWTCVAAAALLTGMASSANAQASGSFQATCRSIQASGGTLTADCRDPSGKYHSSSLAYTQCKGDIGNNNGTLFCNGATATSGPQGGGNSARGGNAGASSGADASSGSFRATCRNVQTSGATLRADCADPSGRYHGSSIAFGQCRGDISNANGMLSCNGATAIADGANNNGFNGSNNGNGRNDGGNNGNNGRNDNGRNDNFGNNGNDQRGFSNGPNNGFGRNDNGPDYRGQPGPRYDNGGRDAQFAPGPYPQFGSSERNIAMDIRDGQRDGHLSRRDANDLTDQLQQIQDREMRIYREQGRYIHQDDSRRIARDLDLLSQAVHRAERR